MQYVVLGEITTEQYQKLLAFAISYSHAFGISIFKRGRKDYTPTYHDFFQSVAPYELDKYQFSSPQHYTSGQNFLVYELNENTQKHLMCRNSFWDWKLPAMPEDLSFYRYKKVWLNCITHEKMVIIISKDTYLLDFLDSIGIKMRPL